MGMSQSTLRLLKLRKRFEQIVPPFLPGNNDIELADEQIGLNAAIPSDNDAAISSQNAESIINEPLLILMKVTKVKKVAYLTILKPTLPKVLMN